MSSEHPTGKSGNPIDASVSIIVSQDMLTAYLLIDPPENGGAQFVPQMIDQALKTSKVSFGVDTGLLEKLKSQPDYSEKIAFAHGKAPVNGKDGAIRYLFKTAKEGRPREREDGTVDYRDLGIIQNIRKGETLCEITYSTDGTEGINVFGGKIPPVNGQPIASPVGQNTVLSEDKTKLIATVDGQIVFSSPTVSIVETYIIQENVDASTGNIKFIGNVRINGDVTEGFLVEAGGTVEVNGTVQGGTVQAGGNIAIHGGVVGMGRGKIVCGGDLNGAFFENCELSAAGSVKAQSIMNCRVKCGKNLELTGMHARLMGGRYVVGGDVVADSIGSPANLPTVLVLGNAPEIVTQRSELAKKIGDISLQIHKLEQIITLLEKMEREGHLREDKKIMLEKSQYSFNELSRQLETAEKEIKELNSRILNAEKGKIACKGTVYRGTTLSIGFAKLEIKEQTEAVCFSKKEEKIVAEHFSAY